MPIKQPKILSRADFDQAVVRLRLNVSDIAKATGIPRTYLSEFRNGDRVLRPEHQAKLRDYFEGKGVEFDDASAGGNDDAPADKRAPSSPHPRLRAVASPRCYFQVAANVPDEVVVRTMELMDENDARIAALLKQTVERSEGFFGDGELSDDAKAALQEAGALCAESYVLFRMLRGWPAFAGVKPSAEGSDTLGSTLFALYRPKLEEAGLIEPEQREGDGQAHDDGDKGDQSKEKATAKNAQFPWMPTVKKSKGAA